MSDLLTKLGIAAAIGLPALLVTAVVCLWQGRQRWRPISKLRRADDSADLGRQALRDGRHDEAVKHFSAALHDMPNASLLYLLRAEAWEGLDKMRRAIDDCTRAIELNCYEVQSYRIRARLRCRVNDTEAAFDDLYRIAELDLADVECLAAAARLLLDGGQYGRAIEIANRLIARKADVTDGYRLRGLALQHLGQFDEAFSDFSRALHLAPDVTELHDQLAYCQIAWKQREQGAIELELSPVAEDVSVEPPSADTTTTEDPLTSTAGLYERGKARFSQGRVEAALADWNVVLEREPDHAAARSDRGWLRFQNGEHSLAFTDFSRACELVPNSPDALYGRARCRMATSEWVAAATDFDQMLAHNPHLRLPHFYRALCRIELGEFSGAISDLQTMVIRDPSHSQTTNALARLLATCPDERYRDGTRAIELAGAAVNKLDCGEHRDTLACAYAESGDFVSAVEQAQLALRDDSLSAESRAEVGRHCAEFWSGRPVRASVWVRPVLAVVRSELG